MDNRIKPLPVFIMLVVLLFGCEQPSTKPAPTATAQSQTPVMLPTIIPQPTPISTEILTQALTGQIVFYSERDGDAEIYIMNPDGTLIAFSVWGRSAGMGVNSLKLVGGIHD